MSLPFFRARLADLVPDHSLTMDCQFARWMLDAGRPDRSDWHAPELRAANQHVQSCRACQSALRQSQQWDEQLAGTLADIELPAGLEQRLLDNLSTTPVPAGPLPSGLPAGRRSARWFLTAAAVMLLLFGGWGVQQALLPRMSLEEVFARLEEEFPAGESLPPGTSFVGFIEQPLLDVAPTDPVWGAVMAGGNARGLDLDGHPGAEAAVYRFRQRRVSGWLVVLPRSQVSNPPAVTWPLHALHGTGPRPQVAWSTGSHVYVCVLERGTLDELHRAFYGATT